MGGDSYSELFHEARMLLDEEDYSAILSRCRPYLTLRVEDGLGVYVDAAVMRAIALKASGGEYWADKETKKAFNLLHPGIVAYFDSGSRFLDSAVLEMLCGKAPRARLPPGMTSMAGMAWSLASVRQVTSAVASSMNMKSRPATSSSAACWHGSPETTKPRVLPSTPASPPRQNAATNITWRNGCWRRSSSPERFKSKPTTKARPGSAGPDNQPTPRKKAQPKQMPEPSGSGFDLFGTLGCRIRLRWNIGS